MLYPLLVAAVVSQAPAPTASPLKTIIRIRTSPLCTTIRQNVVHILDGFQANDGIVNASKPVLLRMGTELQPAGIQGQQADTQGTHLNGISSEPGGTHDTNPALVLDNQRLKQLANELQHNLAIIESALADPTNFPAQTTSDDQNAMQQLKAQLQAIAAQQNNSLELISGLTETFSMQDLIAKGDGTQGVLNSPVHAAAPACPAINQNPQSGCGAAILSHDDQDVGFSDPISASAQQNIMTVKDPSVDRDPAVSQRGSDLSNNPMARFYLGVSANQHQTLAAEGNLGQTLKDLAAGCGP
ncbi:MAG TPA: hypothetical protein VMB20_10815 [Candidatus Acidoferrum sp.]|nr:hypothetical protein [Candidatus Acidoferrum sp.]